MLGIVLVAEDIIDFDNLDRARLVGRREAARGKPLLGCLVGNQQSILPQTSSLKQWDVRAGLGRASRAEGIHRPRRHDQRGGGTA